MTGTQLLASAGQDILDTTHFDTVRFPPPRWALQEFCRAAEDGAAAYTEYRGAGAVRADLAPRLSAFVGVDVDPERGMVITPGTQAGLFATLSALVGSVRRVVLPDPDYLFTARMLRVLGAEPRRVPFAATSLLDLDALDAALRDGPALLVLSNPNNPTGAVLPPEHVAAIARLAAAHDALVVADELYSRLVYGVPFDHLAAHPDAAGRCVTLLGPSKTESLSGYRVGVVLGPPSIMDRVEDVVSLLALRAPAYSQHVLRGWLREDEGWLSQRVRDLQTLRDLTLTHFRRLPWAGVASPDGAAYVFPDVSPLRLADERLAEILVERARVRVTPGFTFGASGRGHFRVCFARDEVVWAAALDRMVDVLRSLLP